MKHNQSDSIEPHKSEYNATRVLVSSTRLVISRYNITGVVDTVLILYIDILPRNW